MLFGIIFYVLRYLKKYDFEIFGDLNNLENELENGNVNCDFDIYFYDLCDGYFVVLDWNGIYQNYYYYL